MNWQTLLNPEVCGRICLTLVHSLWQAALLAALAWLVDRAWARRRVERSYVVFTAAMFLSVAALPLTYCLLENQVRSSGSEPLATNVTLQRFETTPPVETTTSATSHAPALEPQEPRISAKPFATASDNRIQPAASPQTTAISWKSFAPWIVAFYSLGVLAMLFRLAHAIWSAQRFAAKATVIRDGILYQLVQSLSRQWSLKVVPVLAQTEQIVVPKVIGLFRPMILLPAAAVSNLTPDELAMILAHELAHVRRFDLWVNLFQRLAETVLFFNPAIWFFSRRVSTLREYCCDELVCRRAAEPTGTHKLRYAQALVRIAELHVGSPAKALPKTADLMALAAEGKSASELRRRIAHLFGEPLQEPLRITRGGMLSFAVVMLMLCVAAPAISRKTEAPPSHLILVSMSKTHAQFTAKGDANHLATLTIGDGKDEKSWTSQSASSGQWAIAVERSDQIKLDNNRLGAGLVFRVVAPTASSTTFIAMDGQGDDIPAGEISFRSESEVTEENGAITFADIKTIGRKLVPIAMSFGQSVPPGVNHVLHEHDHAEIVEGSVAPHKTKLQQETEPSVDNPEKQERATLSGQIVMEDGSPAKVKGWLESVTSYRTGPHSTKSIHATEDECLDRFTVKIVAGKVWLTYFPTDHAFAWLGPFEVKPGEKLENLKIVLSEGYSATIRVLDEHGKPVANASLEKFPKVGDAQSGPSNPTLTNQNGECILQHLADVAYAIEIKAPGFEPLRIEPRKLEPNQTVTVTMTPGQPAGGIVVGPDGEPIAGAKIRFRGERIAKGQYSGGSNNFGNSVGDAWSATNQAGRFELNELAKSSYYLFIAEAPDKSRVVVRDIQAGKLDTRIEIPKRQDLTIRIIGDLKDLRERNGKRFVSVRQVVPFNSPNGNYQDLIGDNVLVEPTAEGGQAIYQGLVRGTVRVEAGNQSQTIDVANDGTTQVVLQLKPKLANKSEAAEPIDPANLEPATLSGRIVLEDGSPAKVKSWLYSHSFYETGPHSSNGSSSTEGQFTDTFSVEVPAGTVSLTYFPDNYAPAWVGPLEVKPGQKVEDLQIILKPGHSTPVCIVNAQNEPIGGATLVAIPTLGDIRSGPSAPKTANENGEYVFEHLAVANYALTVKAAGYEPLRLEPREFRADELLTFTMQESKPTTGVVLDSEGSPVEGAKIRFRYEVVSKGSNQGEGYGYGPVWATTDSDGRFTLNQLTVGSQYLFVVEGPDDSRMVMRDIVAGQEDVRIQMPKRRDLHVRVIGDLKDLPSRKPSLSIRQQIPVKIDSPHRTDLVGGEASVTSTPEGGEATYHGLVEGTVQIIAGDKRQTFDVAAEGTTEVVLQLKPKLAADQAAIMGRIVLEDGTPATTKGWAASQTWNGTKGSMVSLGQFQDVFSVKVPAGKTWLKYFPDHYAPTWAGPLELKPGQVLEDVVLTLKPGVPTPLQVQNEAGERIPNAKVVALPIIGGDANGSPSNPRQTNDQGEYAYPHLAAIEYEFKAMAPGYEPLSTKATVDGEKSTITLTMTRSNPTTGKVLMPDGSPAADAKFLLLWRGINGGRGGASFSYDRVIATTDADGNFSLDELRRADTYTIVVQAADNSRLLLKELRAGQKNLDLKIPPRRDLKVRITGDLKQLPKSRGELSLQIWQPINTTGASGGFQGSAPITPTPDGGEAVFEGLLEGEVKVTLGDQVQTVPVSPTDFTEIEFNLVEVNPGAKAVAEPVDLSRSISKKWTESASNTKSFQDLGDSLNTNFNRLVAAEKQLKATVIAYDYGTIPFDVLVDAQRRLLDTENTYVDSQFHLSHSVDGDLLLEEKKVSYARHKVRFASKARDQALQTWRAIYEKHQKQHGKDKALAKDEVDARGQYFYFRERLKQAEGQLVALDRK